MNNSQLHKYLENTETRAEDEFTLLEDCGAEYFSTSDLLEMRGVWKERVRMYSKLHRLNMGLVLSAPLWPALGFVFVLCEMPAAVRSAVVLFFVHFVLFIFFAFFIKINYNSKGHLDYTGRQITGELLRRQNEAAAQKRKN